jgi:PPOX class probable F420-dependent enzyme
MPHVVPVCYALIAAAVYFTIDEKPKRRAGGELKRLANLRANPSVALVVDRYDEDWSRLGWVMVQGQAEILAAGAEHDLAQACLRLRYPQLVPMRIEDLPVVALRVAHVAHWGRLQDP